MEQRGVPDSSMGYWERFTMQLPKFNNQNLLRQALTHRSAINEGKGRANNERLEFLGDAVIELVVSDFVYRTFPNRSEGELTQTRTALVRTETLASLSQSLGLDQKMFLSRGEEQAGGRQNQSLLADTLEAVVGALYLDQGLPQADSFLMETLLKGAEEKIQKAIALDAKSKLQEIIQAKGDPTPSYRIIKKQGPDHNRLFTAEVLVSGKTIAAGVGKSKQEAEQDAAKNALSVL